MEAQKAGNQLNLHKGFSLIEAAIVLGIVGLVIGGIWAAAAAVSENLRVSRTISSTLSLLTEARKNYAQTDFSSLDGQYLMLDPTLFANLDGFQYVNQYVALDAWGHGINAQFLAADAFSPDRFELDFYDLSSKSCMRLISAFAQPMTGMNYMHTAAVDVLASDLPYRPVAADCPTNANTVVMRFNK